MKISLLFLRHCEDVACNRLVSIFMAGVLWLWSTYVMEEMVKVAN